MRISNAPVDDVVGMQVLDSLQDLPGVVTKHLLVKRAEAGEQVIDGATGHKLHEDADDGVLKTRAQVSEHSREYPLVLFED